MNSLLVRYREFLTDEGVPGEGYTRQHLKDRLKNCFGEEVVFHQQMDRAKPELIYASSIRLQDVINAWALTQQVESKVSMRKDSIRSKKDGIQEHTTFKGSQRKLCSFHV